MEYVVLLKQMKKYIKENLIKSFGYNTLNVIVNIKFLYIINDILFDSSISLANINFTLGKY